MSIEIEFSSIFAKYTGNQTDIKVEGKTVGECLHDLARRYPDFGKMLFDKNGELSALFDIFIDKESVYPNIMRHPVQDGDKLNIVMLIHGG